MSLIFKRLLLCTGLLIFCIAYANASATTKADEMANIKQLWEIIDSNVASIEGAVADQKFNRIHYYTNTLRVAIKSLPSFSSLLSEEQLAQVKSKVKSAEEIVDKIDGAGHAEKAVVIRKSLGELQPVLAEIRANYSDTTT